MTFLPLFLMIDSHESWVWTTLSRVKVSFFCQDLLKPPCQDIFLKSKKSVYAPFCTQSESSNYLKYSCSATLLLRLKLSNLNIVMISSILPYRQKPLLTLVLGTAPWRHSSFATMSTPPSASFQQAFCVKKFCLNHRYLIGHFGWVLVERNIANPAYISITII